MGRNLGRHAHRARRTLTTLALAVGITAVNPGNTNAQVVGTTAAFWTAASLLIALFIGGLAATRLGMVFDRATGAFEGALVWVLSFIVILWLASVGVRLVAIGMSGIFGGVTQTVGAAAANSTTDLSAGSAQRGAGTTAWIMLVAMVISLLAAIAGAMIGRRRALRRMAETEAAMTASMLR